MEHEELSGTPRRATPAERLLQARFDATIPNSEVSGDLQ